MGSVSEQPEGLLEIQGDGNSFKTSSQFEAMLIAMLVFMFLDKMNARHQRPAVFWGMAGGVVVSLLLAIGFKKIHGITGAHQELFEGSVMLIASGMLAYCALFCHNAKEHVEGKVDKAIDSGNSFILSHSLSCSCLSAL